jgi:hypothetical protein
MFRKSLTIALFVLIVLTTITAMAAGPGKVETVSALSNPSAPSAISAALDSTGFQLTLFDGSVIEVWLRKSLPLAKQKDSQAVYPDIARSTFIGAITFERQVSDFRGQPIKPGTYTLRYESLPSDGNHMGVAPQPDFVLLVPIAADPGPDAMPTYDELVKLSAKAAGTSHPAVFSMTPVEGTAALPSLFYTSDGFVAFAVAAKTQSGKLPLAIIIKGVAEQ